MKIMQRLAFNVLKAMESVFADEKLQPRPAKPFNIEIEGARIRIYNALTGHLHQELCDPESYAAGYRWTVNINEYSGKSGATVDVCMIKILEES